jgi:hypothetical protein
MICLLFILASSSSNSFSPPSGLSSVDMTSLVVPVRALFELESTKDAIKEMCRKFLEAKGTDAKKDKKDKAPKAAAKEEGGKPPANTQEAGKLQNPTGQSVKEGKAAKSKAVAAEADPVPKKESKEKKEKKAKPGKGD